MALTKADGLAAYTYYQYPSESDAMCSHALAMMKLVAKQVIDKINKIAETKAGTSKLRAWFRSQSRERLEKLQASSLETFSPTATI